MHCENNYFIILTFNLIYILYITVFLYVDGLNNNKKKYYYCNENLTRTTVKKYFQLFPFVKPS